MRTAAIRNLHQQGALTQTDNKLDLGINGRGWFQITGANGEHFYTRAGAFNKNPGRPARDARRLPGAADDHIPQDARDIIINETGEVYVDDRPAGGSRSCSASSRWRTSSTRPASSRWATTSTARRMPRAIRVTSACPAIPASARIHQGYLENSNVDPVKEITELISAQRAYEMNSKVIQAVDRCTARSPTASGNR